MTTNREVHINIKADGHVTIDAKNFQGNGCAAATAPLELTLGGTDASNKSDKRKPEFAMNPGARQTN